MKKTLHNLNPRNGSVYAFISFLHIVVGIYLGAFYKNQVNSEFDKLLLRFVDVLYALKDAF